MHESVFRRLVSGAFVFGLRASSRLGARPRSRVNYSVGGGEIGGAIALRLMVPERRRMPAARGYMPAISTPAKRVKRDVIVKVIMMLST